MRHFVIVPSVLAIAISAGVSLADQPTTKPSTEASLTGDIYLIPFTAIGSDNHLDWAGKAVQQNLFTDLARVKLHPVASDRPVALAEARNAAKESGAKYLITGTYQSTDQSLRFNGQIIDVRSGQVEGGITTTGAERDLFMMEDALSTQAIRQLTQLPGVMPTSAIVKPAAVIPSGLQPAVVQLIQPPAVGIGSSYQGSALEQYVDSNRTPSTDFHQQLEDSRDRVMYQSDSSDGGIYGEYFGGYGLGLFDGFGLSYSGIGYGRADGGYFGHGGHWAGFSGAGQFHGGGFHGGGRR